MNAKLTKRKEDTSVSTLSEAVWVNANAVLQKALQNSTTEGRVNFILRCDELPLVQLSEESLEKAFTALLPLIVENRQPGTKLFLHISCTKELISDKDVDREDESCRYQVQFHSNTSPYTDWMQQNQRQINNIAALLVPVGGSFVVNHLKNPGCIFCITLPGK